MHVNRHGLWLRVLSTLSVVLKFLPTSLFKLETTPQKVQIKLCSRKMLHALLVQRRGEGSGEWMSNFKVILKANLCFAALP